ncbi:MAG: signal peptidase II [Anaerotignum sp.]|nr:signal peptidase II [Anaerotignum sp.]MBR5123444.1 signal peptidase II [Anaerotignum sp.]
MNILPIIAVVVLILLDQGTKFWALARLKPIHNMTLVEGFMDLTFVENRGVAFGMFSGQRWFILLLTGVIAVGLIWFYMTMPKKKEYFPLRVSLVLVLSGAIGNIIDRLFRGYVVDFFEFTFFEWPVFNVADIYVVVGVILLALMILFVVKDEDLELKKKKGE